MQENITIQERNSLNLLTGNMVRFDFGTPEYELSRKAFAFLCGRIRNKVWSDRENVDKKYE